MAIIGLIMVLIGGMRVEENREAAVAALLNSSLWESVPGDMLKGCIAMYRATGEEQYKTAVLLHLYSILLTKWRLPSNHAWFSCYGGYGNALLFALDETGDERFQTAAGEIFDLFRPRIDPGDYRVRPYLDKSEVGSMAAFLTAYDTRFGKKQVYKEIARRFSDAHRMFFMPDEGHYRISELRQPGEGAFSDDGVMLCALIDTLGSMDMQIYEHWRSLADQFLTAVQGLSRHLDRSGVLRSMVEAPDDIASARVLYALHKGVRLKLLDEEKYLPIAADSYAAWRKELNERTLCMDIEGACMMVNGEMKMGEEKRK